MSETVLFAVPYAGGSAAAAYGRWTRLLAPNIRLSPLEPPGHGRRMAEPLTDSIEATVADLLERVRPVAAEQPYAFYGHSMGCTIVYELVKALEKGGLPPPRGVILSGRNPPHHLYRRNHLHVLSDERFLEEIRQIGGTPEAFFEMPDLLKAFLPVLRNDYRIIELYRFNPPAHVMDTDVLFVCSDRDAMVEREAAVRWRDYCAGRFAIRDFPGGHFFINDHGEAICRLIGQWLA